MTLKEFFSNKYVVLILKLLLIGWGIYTLFNYKSLILSLIFPLFIALIIAYLLNPIVVYLHEKKVPRGISVLIIYVIFFFLIYIIISKFIPVVSAEISRLESLIPEYSANTKEFLINFNEEINRLELPESLTKSIQENSEKIEQGIIDFFKAIPQIGISIAMGTFQLFLIFVYTFYMLRDYYLVQSTFFRFISPKRKQKFVKVLGEIDDTLGAYIRGQLLICFLIGSMTYLGLRVLGVEFAVVLGIISGITNIIPYFGPWIGSVPAVIVAFFQEPMLAVKVIIWITIIQQIESAVVAPNIIGKKMGMHPLVVIFSLIAGGKMIGVIGMIIAVPTVAVIRILLRNFLSPYLPKGIFKIK